MSAHATEVSRIVISHNNTGTHATKNIFKSNICRYFNT
jgi:hypothetical protein